MTSKKEHHSWAPSQIQNINDRAEMVRLELNERLGTLGIDPKKITHIVSIHRNYGSWNGTTNLVVSVGAYPDPKKGFREPKRGFDLDKIADTVAIAVDRDNKRVAAYAKKHRLWDEWDAKSKELKTYSLDNARVSASDTGIRIDVGVLDEIQAQRILNFLKFIQDGGVGAPPNPELDEQ